MNDLKVATRLTILIGVLTEILVGIGHLWTHGYRAIQRRGARRVRTSHGAHPADR